MKIRLWRDFIAKSTLPQLFWRSRGAKEEDFWLCTEAAVMRASKFKTFLAKEKLRAWSVSPSAASEILYYEPDHGTRSVVRAIEESARATYEVLKDMWLNLCTTLFRRPAQKRCKCRWNTVCPAFFAIVDLQAVILAGVLFCQNPGYQKQMSSKIESSG